jgi:hypothetical protein
MTRAERAAVVELLRCVVDRSQLGYAYRTYHYTPLGDAAIALGHNPGGFNFRNTQSDIERLAMEAVAHCNGGFAWGCAKDPDWVALEAAARVEEGTWP